MSRKILRRDQKSMSKEFTSRAPDSKQPSQGPVIISKKGIMPNFAPPAPGPTVLSQRPVVTPLGLPAIVR